MNKKPSRAFRRPPPAQIDLEPTDTIVTTEGTIEPSAPQQSVPEEVQISWRGDVARKVKSSKTKSKIMKKQKEVVLKPKVARSGRAPKPEGEAFIHVIPVRLNNADFDKLQSVARRQAVPLAACARGVMQLGLKSFRAARSKK